MKQPWQVEHHASLLSTQAVAKDRARAGHPGRLAIVADAQTAGRGRLGRTWVAPPGANLAVSVLLRPNLPVTQAYTLTMLAGVALCCATEQVAQIPAALKWPNDLVLPAASYRKAAGILTEIDIKEKHVQWAVLGIGINANASPSGLVDGRDLAQTATSLAAVTGRALDRAALLAALLSELDRWAAVDAAALFVAWRARLATLGQRITVQTAAAALSGVAEAVASDGSLLLRDAAGALHTVTSGDVGA